MAPNDLWCADFKGEFKLGSGQDCYPLTVTDHASRFLLLCEALESTREDTAITAFEQLFLERGLPGAIRSDNGVPFAPSPAPMPCSTSPSYRCGGCAWASPSSASNPATHRKTAATSAAPDAQTGSDPTPGMNSLQQQTRFDDFVLEFNTERPHEALEMNTPAEVYAASPRPYRGLPDISYPLHDREVVVTACGRICMHRKGINAVLQAWRLSYASSMARATTLSL